MAHGGMWNGKYQGAKHQHNTTIVCVMCGDRRECSREDVKTCGVACRRALARYVARWGHAPDEPPGRSRR